MRESTKSSAHNFRTFPGISSGPVALCSLMPFRSFRTPALLTSIWPKLGMFGGGISPWGGSGESESGTEKTDENWSLRRLAFSKGDEIIFSAETRSGIPIFSVLFLLMYDQSFLVHPSSETKFPTYCEYAFLHSRWHSLLTSRYLFLTLSDWECLNLAYHLCFFS